MVSDEAIPTKLRIGAAIGDGIKIYFRNFWVFFLTGLVVLLPYAAVSLLFGNAASISGVMDGAGVDPSAGASGVVAAIVGAIAGAVLIAAITFGTAQYHSGEKPSLSAMLRQSLNRLVHVIGISIISYIIIVLPFIVLAASYVTGNEAIMAIAGIISVVGVVYLWFGVALSIPATIIERLGVIPSIRRSFALAKGSRWRMLGFFILFFILATLVSLVIWAPFTFAVAFGEGAVGTLAFSFAEWFGSSLSYGVFAAMFASLYFHMRTAKEGKSFESLAAIFD